MTARDGESYEPPVAEDVEASEGPVVTAPGDAGTTDDTTTTVAR
jgi:hypothetical protein